MTLFWNNVNKTTSTHVHVQHKELWFEQMSTFALESRMQPKCFYSECNQIKKYK